MPGFRVGKPRTRLRVVGDVAMAAGFQIVPWTEVDYDEPASFDAPDGIVVERAGLYLISFRAARQATGTSQSLIAAPAINGVRLPTTRLAASTTAITGGASSDVVELENNDRVTLEVQGHASGGWTLYAAHCCLSVVRIGPVRWT